MNLRGKDKCLETKSARSESSEVLFTKTGGKGGEGFARHVRACSFSCSNSSLAGSSCFFSRSPIEMTNSTENLLTRSTFEMTAKAKEPQSSTSAFLHLEGAKKELPLTLKGSKKKIADAKSNSLPISPFQTGSRILFPLISKTSSVAKRGEIDSSHSNSLDSIVLPSGRRGLNYLSPPVMTTRFAGPVSASFPNDLAFGHQDGEKFVNIQRATPPLSSVSKEEKLVSPCSLRSLQANESASFAGHQQPKRTVLQSLNLIQDPSVANAVREQNRATLIAELERQKLALQLQLAQLRKEITDQNVFSLVWSSNASQLQCLLETGLCDVNMRDYNGSTPLHLAALVGDVAIVRVLVSFGANVMAIDKTGRTPLDWAAVNRHSNVFHCLLSVIQRLFLQQLPGDGNELTIRGESVNDAGGKTNSFFLHLSDDYNKKSNTALSFLQQGEDISLESFLQLTEAKTSDKQKETFFSTFASRCVERSSSLSTPLPCVTLKTATAETETAAEAVVVDGVDVGSKLSRYSSCLTLSDTVSYIVCMVGLPGRGKSFIACRLARYLNWKGVPCRVFNAGNYRRKLIGLEDTVKPGFYDPDNVNGKMLRDMMADIACDALMKFISRFDIAVGIFDATNTTKQRRAHLLEFFSQAASKLKVKYSVIFIESICTDSNVITENILRSKCRNDDFKNFTDMNEVISSFYFRIAQYEKVYEPLDVSEGVSFIRIINAKSHVVMHKIPCGIASRIGFFLLNLHPIAYPIYIVLPGETEDEHDGVYGGSERLTPFGEKFALELKRFILNRVVPHMVVLHGTKPSVLNTLKPLAHALRCGAARGVACDYGCSEKVKNKKQNEEMCDGAVCCFACHEELLCPLPGLEDVEHGCLSEQMAELTRGSDSCLPLRPLDTSQSTGSVEAEMSFGETTQAFVNIAGGDDVLKEGQQGQSKPFPVNCSEKSRDTILRFCSCSDGAASHCLRPAQCARGENYWRVSMRLEPVLMAVMRSQGPVFVVATPAPAQGVFGYFTDIMPEMLSALHLPRHAVVEIGVNGDITEHKLLEPSEHVSGTKFM